MDLPHYDVLVVGAGAAGRSAALVLGRARRRVALVDSGTPSNAPSTGVGGLVGFDGRPPAELYAASDEELARYESIARLSGEVTALARDGEGSSWRAALADGRGLTAAAALLATGMDYAHPPLPGITTLWGGSVFHCPFCHGWEHRDRPLAVLGGDPTTVERTLLLHGWTRDLRVIAPAGSLSPDEAATLAAAAVEIVEGEVRRLLATGRSLEGIELVGGRVLAPVEGLLVPAPHRQRSGLVGTTGADTTDTSHVVVDALGHTSVPDLWAAGDLTSPLAQVARAVGAGAVAATAIVRSLTVRRYGLSPLAA